MPCKKLKPTNIIYSNLYGFGKRLQHGQQKRSPFENPKTYNQWQYV